MMEQTYWRKAVSMHVHIKFSVDPAYGWLNVTAVSVGANSMVRGQRMLVLVPPGPPTSALFIWAEMQSDSMFQISRLVTRLESLNQKTRDVVS
jgi:hypothetical protein